MEALLRPARPTVEEGFVFARFLDVSADGLFRLLLGSRAERIVAAAYREPGHDLSYEHTTFAVVGSDIVGMVSAYSADRHHRSQEEPLYRLAGWRGFRMGVVALAGLRFFQFLNNVPDGDFYLQAIAVSADRRGGGIGSQLFTATEERAAAAGCRRLVLDVDVANARASRLYGRLGMSVEATSPKAWLLGGAQVHRMTKGLPAAP